MVESIRQIQSRDPFDRFDEAVNDPRLYETRQYPQPYALPSERADTRHDDLVPDTIIRAMADLFAAGLPMGASQGGSADSKLSPAAHAALRSFFDSKRCA